MFDLVAWDFCDGGIGGVNVLVGLCIFVLVVSRNGCEDWEFGSCVWVA